MLKIIDALVSPIARDRVLIASSTNSLHTPCGLCGPTLPYVAHMASPCYAWQPQAHGVGCQSTSEYIQRSGHTTIPYTYIPSTRTTDTHVAIT